MTSPISRSEQLFHRALKVLPGGASRNAIVRKPYPCYSHTAQGCVITDVDGIRRIDFANNMASLIHGHAHPAIIAAVTTQLPNGTAFNFATELEVEFAEHLVSRTKSFQKIRFVNSGTEAIMCALKAARAYTQRSKIAKVEGAYHGIYDFAEISQTAQPANWGDEAHPASVPVVRGTPPGVLNDVIVIPFNESQRALDILDRHADDLACVLVDPLPHRVCMSLAGAEYIAALRRWTREHGALLVFDEVITYRTTYGGAQELFEDRPDLTAMGKIIGGGFPVGALAGSAEVMDVFNPVASKVLFPHSGTFSANPITMTAGLTAMRLYDQAAVEHVNALGERARRQIAEAIREADIPACVTGNGSLFRIHMKPQPPRNYRECYNTPRQETTLKMILDYAFNNGINLIGTGSGTISTPMTPAEIDRLTEVLYAAFQKTRGSCSLIAATP